jgi:hypothetical protein
LCGREGSGRAGRGHLLSVFASPAPRRWPAAGPPHPPPPPLPLSHLQNTTLQTTAVGILASTVKDAYDELFTDACAACAGSGRLTCPHCDGSATARARPGDSSLRSLSLVTRGPRDTYRCQHCGPPSPYDLDFDHDLALDAAGVPYNADAADAFRENIHQALLGRSVLPVTFPPLAGTVRCPACGGSPRVRRHTPATSRLLPATALSPAVRAATLAGDLAPIEAGAFMDEAATSAAFGIAEGADGKQRSKGAWEDEWLGVGPPDASALAAAGAAAAEAATGARRGFFRRLVRRGGGSGGQHPRPPPRAPARTRALVTDGPRTFGEVPSRPHVDREVEQARLAAAAGPAALAERGNAFPDAGAPPGLPPGKTANDFVYPYMDDDLAEARVAGDEEEEGEADVSAEASSSALAAFQADLGEVRPGSASRGKGRSSLLGGDPRGRGGRYGAREMEGFEGEGGGEEEDGPPREPAAGDETEDEED